VSCLLCELLQAHDELQCLTSIYAISSARNTVRAWNVQTSYVPLHEDNVPNIILRDQRPNILTNLVSVKPKHEVLKTRQYNTIGA
jgi:hypothetical protein